MERYRTWEGVVVQRRPLPSGDVVVWFVGPEGPLVAVARGAQRPTARSGRLSLFSRLGFQTYQRPDQELPVITQVEALERLGSPEPRRFALASLVAELALKGLSPEAAVRGYGVLVSGLRGVRDYSNPLAAAVWAGFRLMAHAGYSPRGSGPYLHPSGELTGEPGAGAVYLGEEGVRVLGVVLTRPGREAIPALESAPLDRLLAALLRFGEAQLGELRSARVLGGLLRL